jgi:aminoglycoside phosphotransferase (APT) family kinase protein
LVTGADGALERPHAIARSLLGGPVDVLCPVNGGRNSRVYRIEYAGCTYALKQYPPRDTDPRDRLGTEAAALGLMQRHGIDRIPRLLAMDRQQGFALLTWLEGMPVTALHEADVDAAAEFLAALHALRRAGEFAPEHLASEACLSRGEIVRQLEMRFARLRTAAANETELQTFLDGPYAAAFEEVTRRTEVLEFDADAPLAPESRSLVPSDFGFHNSLRKTDGSLVFFDFEYFGWDDPVKMTADFMLHPGTRLPSELRRRFCGAAKAVYGADPWFARRLEAYYPLFGLRWVLILLNEFVRTGAGGLAGATESWQASKERQLAKARQFLGGVRSEHGRLDGA